MKKFYYLIIFLFVLAISTNCRQPNQKKDVAAAVTDFITGIINADKGLIETITADQLVYGHSSGKVQNKSEFIEEIVSLLPNDYLTIDLTEQVITVAGKTALVRHIYSSEYTSNGVPGNLKIGNMLIWQKQHGKWKLLASQAYKI
jgi:hypothetical protein